LDPLDPLDPLVLRRTTQIPDTPATRHTKLPFSFHQMSDCKEDVLEAPLAAAAETALAAAAGTTRLTHPTCDVKGISWCKGLQKWQITVYDSFATGKRNDPWRHTDYTFGIDEKDQAIAKHAQIKAEVDARWKRETERIASRYSWTRNLPRAPDKAKDAKKDTTYWKENERDGYRPRRVVVGKRGKEQWQYKLACHADACTSSAQPDATGGLVWCHRHQHEHGVSNFKKRNRPNYTQRCKIRRRGSLT